MDDAERLNPLQGLGDRERGGLEPGPGVGGIRAVISASTKVRSSYSGAHRWAFAVSSTGRVGAWLRARAAAARQPGRVPVAALRQRK